MSNLKVRFATLDETFTVTPMKSHHELVRFESSERGFALNRQAVLRLANAGALVLEEGTPEDIKELARTELPTVYDLLSEAQELAIEALDEANAEYEEWIEAEEDLKAAVERGDASAWDLESHKFRRRLAHQFLQRTAEAEHRIADALGAANKAPRLH